MLPYCGRPRSTWVVLAKVAISRNRLRLDGLLCSLAH